MPLYVSTPINLQKDPSIYHLFEFCSEADRSIQKIDLYFPQEYRKKILPLVIAPHPITWTAEEDYHGGLTGAYFRGYHSGWYGLAEKYQVLMPCPMGILVV